MAQLYSVERFENLSLHSYKIIIIIVIIIIINYLSRGDYFSPSLQPFQLVFLRGGPFDFS